MSPTIETTSTTTTSTSTTKTNNKSKRSMYEKIPSTLSKSSLTPPHLPTVPPAPNAHTPAFDETRNSSNNDIRATTTTITSTTALTATSTSTATGCTHHFVTQPTPSAADFSRSLLHISVGGAGPSPLKSPESKSLPLSLSSHQKANGHGAIRCSTTSHSSSGPCGNSSGSSRNCVDNPGTTNTIDDNKGASGRSSNTNNGSVVDCIELDSIIVVDSTNFDTDPSDKVISLDAVHETEVNSGLFIKDQLDHSTDNKSYRHSASTKTGDGSDFNTELLTYCLDSDNSDNNNRATNGLETPLQKIPLKNNTLSNLPRIFPKKKKGSNLGSFHSLFQPESRFARPKSKSTSKYSKKPIGASTVTFRFLDNERTNSNDSRTRPISPIDSSVITIRPIGTTILDKNRNINHEPKVFEKLRSDTPYTTGAIIIGENVNNNQPILPFISNEHITTRIRPENKMATEAMPPGGGGTEDDKESQKLPPSDSDNNIYRKEQEQHEEVKTRKKLTSDPNHVSHQFFHVEPCRYSHRMFIRAAQIFSVLKQDDADTEENKALRRRQGQSDRHGKAAIPEMDFIDAHEQIKTFELTFATLKCK